MKILRMNRLFTIKTNFFTLLIGLFSLSAQGQSFECDFDIECSEIDTNLVMSYSVPEKVFAGDQFCIPVTVETFEYIVSIQLDALWPDSLASILSVNSGNCLDIPQSNFLLQDGSVRLVWFSFIAEGVCCLDGSYLFEMCFEASTNFNSNSFNLELDIEEIGYTLGFPSPDICYALNENVQIVQSFTSVSELELFSTSCSTNGDTYSATFSYPTNQVNFSTYLNSNFIGDFTVENQQIFINNIVGSGQDKDTFFFCQNDIDTCCVELIVNNPCECGYANMTYEITECNEADSTFLITLDFEPQNNSDQFNVGGNGTSYGTFNNADIPITLGPLPADGTEYEFIFFDFENPLCFDFIEIGEIDCAVINACVISNPEAISEDCNEDGNFYVNLSFEVINQGTEGFTVQGNGVNYGNFEYGESLYEIGPLLGDCETIYEFIIIDNEDAECENFTGLEEVVCCDIPECSITDLTLSLECEPFGYLIDFNVVDASSNHFKLFIDDQFFGIFSYEELPLSDNLGNPVFTDNLVTIRVEDSESEECFSIEDNIELEECPQCVIEDLFVEAQDCEDGQFFIDFEFETTAADGDMLDLFINGDLVSSFEYGETFYTAGPIEGDCSTLYEFTVVDQNDLDCSSSFEFIEPICCEMEECDISNAEIELLDCNEEEMSFILNFDNSATTNDFFDVYSRDGIYGSFMYSDLPLTINGFPNTGNDFEFIRICDNDNPEECCQEFEFLLEGCSSSCALLNLTAEILECDSESMNLIIDFDNQAGPNDSFNIFSRDGFFGIFAASELPYTIINFPNTGNDFEFINVCESDDPNCCVETEFSLEECETGCLLSNLTVELLECDSMSMDIIIDFDATGTTNEFFDVFSRDGFFGFFSFSDLPVTITDFPNTGNEFEFIEVCENDNEDCCLAQEWNVIECTTVSTYNPNLPEITHFVQGNILHLSEELRNITIYSTDGRKLKQGDGTILELNNVPTGIYYLTAELSNIRISFPFYRP